MVIELKHEHIDDYKNIHINAWPELLSAEKKAKIFNEVLNEF